ncbi:(deoxy)nucleoside triphosphate pyrophosphohydrolase [Novosphingobium sp. KN65.2]|uniref:(deoxy)nucleoside triphosphate pyrophosphohydrolase n=1 Tax=Novosphingobium sp. KN65.2 TaxID=1478134 RepID=UPI001E29F6AD|nr:(deoxy)nucleoside triphosphate pyrophosphohydrolase [Novosphingobium sp. KN65.2]
MPALRAHVIIPLMKPAKDVAAAIIIHKGRVLVTRRAPGQEMAGLWEFPGGKMEPGETPQACIIRELSEELAIACEAGDVLTSNLHTYPGGAINLIAVRVRMITQTCQLSVHDEARWVDGSELLSLDLAPADIPVAEAVRALLATNTINAE